jgi:hypothetical protein
MIAMRLRLAIGHLKLNSIINQNKRQEDKSGSYNIIPGPRRGAARARARAGHLYLVVW